MLHQGVTYRLTKHGRVRFIERIAYMSDRAMNNCAREELIMNFFAGFDYIVKPDWNRRRDKRLLTVYCGDVRCSLAALYTLMDRPSEFTFHFNEFERRFHHEKRNEKQSFTKCN